MWGKMITCKPTFLPLPLNGVDDGSYRIRPDFAGWVAKSFKEPPIPRQNHTDTMIGEIGVSGEALNDGENVRLHSGTIARFSVQVNTRYNVSAVNAAACYLCRMEKGWFSRLLEMIEADGRSMLALSLAANCGRNFIQQMIKNGKEPGADKLARILEALGPRAALYVFTGLDVSDKDRELLQILSKMDDDLKSDAVRLLQRIATGEVA